MVWSCVKLCVTAYTRPDALCHDVHTCYYDWNSLLEPCKQSESYLKETGHLNLLVGSDARTANRT
jgi:hypothetical protein